MQVMRIVNWSDHFETTENKRLVRFTWLALPTKQEGDGYTELMSAHENGCAHFGAWTALLQLAAKCSPRGTLVRDLGGRLVAHDIASISRITRVPVQVLGEAVPRLVEIGWLEFIDQQEVVRSTGDAREILGDHPGKTCATGQGRTAQDRTGEGEETPPPPASPVPVGAPLTAEGKKAKRRIELLAILKAQGVKLEIASGPIFEEWIADTDGYQLGWIERVLVTTKPRIRFPSALRKALKERAAEYETWKDRA